MDRNMLPALKPPKYFYFLKILEIMLSYASQVFKIKVSLSNALSLRQGW